MSDFIIVIPIESMQLKKEVVKVLEELGGKWLFYLKEDEFYEEGTALKIYIRSDNTFVFSRWWAPYEKEHTPIYLDELGLDVFDHE